MPVIIEEVVITVQANTPATQQTSEGEQIMPPAVADEDAIVRKCVEAVMDLLTRKNER